MCEEIVRHTVVPQFALLVVSQIGFPVGSQVHELHRLVAGGKFIHQFRHRLLRFGIIFSGRVDVEIDVSDAPRLLLLKPRLILLVIGLNLLVADGNRRIVDGIVILHDIADIRFRNVSCRILCGLLVGDEQGFAHQIVVFGQFAVLSDFFLHVQPIGFLSLVRRLQNLAHDGACPFLVHRPCGRVGEKLADGGAHIVAQHDVVQLLAAHSQPDFLILRIHQFRHHQLLPDIVAEHRLLLLVQGAQPVHGFD